MTDEDSEYEVAKILIVDDAPANLDVLIATLRESNFSITIAPSGEKALELAPIFLPDIILLDIRMPGLDGFETCKRLKKDSATKDIPVIFLSADTDPFDIVKAFEIGGLDYITKPFNREEILVRIRTQLRTQTLIKELEESQRELAHSHARIRATVEKAFDGIITLNQQGIIQSFNPAAERIFQYLGSEVIGKDIELLIPSSCQTTTQDSIKNTQGTIKPKLLGDRCELIGKRKNGSSFALDLALNGTHVRNELFFTGIIRDISERKQLEKELKRTTLAAQEASKAKSEFLANTSHEIRTPLNAITGFAGILLKLFKQDRVDKNFEEYLNIIIKSGNTLTEVINNVLDLSKIESGKMEVNKIPFDLQVVVKGAFCIFKHVALEKKIDFQYSIESQVKTFILSDRVKLNQILTNLLGNAIKFTDSGSIDLKVEKSNESILFTVEDTGIGIPSDRLKTIFTPFEQIDSSLIRKYEGTGLGLAISKKMVEVLGGEIWVNSIEGEGTSFFFTIPYDEQLAEKPKIDSYDNITFLKTNKLLLVEDNEENLTLAKVLLQEMGLEPIIARNGVEALEQAKKYQPDLILMDVQMTVMDGLEATARIRKIASLAKTPIVGLSAHALTEHKEQGLKAGLDGYLTKPLELDKLIPILLKYLKPSP